MPVLIIEIPSDLSNAEERLLTVELTRTRRVWLERRDARKTRLDDKARADAQAEAATARLYVADAAR